jgi:hypothetical protein
MTARPSPSPSHSPAPLPPSFLSLSSPPVSLPLPPSLKLIKIAVMLTINRYWLLQRLSIHIGFTLYAVYAGLLAIAFNVADEGMDLDNLHLIKFILITR